MTDPAKQEPHDPFGHPEFDDHEQVIFCRSPEADLLGIIAIHSTRLGPAAGGWWS